LFSFVITVNAQTRKQYTISGNIKNLKYNERVYLINSNLDTVAKTLSKNGNFQLKGTVLQKDFYFIAIPNCDLLSIVIDNGDSLSIVGNTRFFSKATINYISSKRSSQEIKNEKFVGAEVIVGSLAPSFISYTPEGNPLFLKDILKKINLL